MVRFRRAAVGLAAAVVALSVTACGSKSGANRQAAATQPSAVSASAQVATGGSEVNLIWQPGDEQPFYYANATKLWSKYGVNPKLIEVQQGTAELAALASGSADIGLIGPGPFVSGVGRGVPIVAVFMSVDFASLEGLYVNPKSGIHGLKDLVGKTVYVPAGSSADTGLRFGLAKAGIPSNKVSMVNLAPTAIMAGFTRGNIQAAYIWSTWGQRLEAAGASLVSTDQAEGVNAGPTLVVVRKDYLASHPDVVARVIATLNAAGKASPHDPSVAAKALAQYTGVTEKEGLTIAKKEPTLSIADALSSTGPFSLVNEQGLAALLHKIGEQLKQEHLINQVPASMSPYVTAASAKAASGISATE